MAKLRKVKCLYCSEDIDRNTEDYVAIKNRYAHSQCQINHENSLSQEVKDKAMLEKYIITLYGELLPLHRKQIKSLSEAGYSYSGMLKTLQYFFEVRKNSTDKSKGIGIIPYVYKDAYEYFYKLYQLQNKAENIDTSTLNFNTVVVKIKPPQTKEKKGKLIDLDLLEGELENE